MKPLAHSVRAAIGAFVPIAPCIFPPPPPMVCLAAPTGDARDDDVHTNIQWQPASVATLSNFTAWGCTSGIYTGGGIEYVTRIRFDGRALADNGVHVQFASADTVGNSVFVFDTGHGVFPHGPTYVQSTDTGNAYVVYDGPGQVDDSHCIGYDGTTPGNLIFSAFGAARRHTNHLFRGLTFAGGGLPAINFMDFAAMAPSAVLAQPFVWGITARDLDGSLSGGTNVPPVAFVRRAHQTWLAPSFTSSYPPSAQMRQLPVIVRPATTPSAPECVYEIRIQNGPASVARVDLSIDDAALGDVSRFVITHAAFPAWVPTLRATAIDLRLVDTGRTHRITIRW